MNTSHTQGKHTARHEKSSKLSALKKITAIAVIGVLGAASVLSAASASRVAYITDGDETYTVTTVDTDTNGIIEQAGLELSRYDKAIVTEESSERIDINILRAFSVKISADNGARFIEATDGTVADALKAADVKYSANDFITPSLSTKLEEDMVIEVVRGVKVYLTCDGTTNIIYVPEGKVGDALAYMGYQLSNDDSVSVDLDDEVKSGMKISVDRVEYKDKYVKEPIEYATIEEADSTLPAGETKVKQKGEDGVLEIKYSEKYVNGELEESEEVSRQPLRKAVDEIILVGTKTENKESAQAENGSAGVFAEFGSQPSTASFGSLTDANGSAFSYSTMITGICTAYTEPGGITATGTIPRIGTVAVNPNIIPYGSRLYICSADGSYVYGYAIAEDTGGACMSGDIVVDLYMDSEEACNDFGRRELNIYILN